MGNRPETGCRRDSVEPRLVSWPLPDTLSVSVSSMRRGHLFDSQVCPWHFEYCLAQSRCSINICEMNEFIHSLNKTSPVLHTNSSTLKETHLWRLVGKPTALCKKRTKAQRRWEVRNLPRRGACAQCTHAGALEGRPDSAQEPGKALGGSWHLSWA